MVSVESVVLRTGSSLGVGRSVGSGDRDLVVIGVQGVKMGNLGVAGQGVSGDGVYELDV